MPVSEQGVNCERYMLVPRSLIFITCGHKLLLIKGNNDKRLWSGLYNGVGGHVERGEDIRVSAERELFEETGINKTDLWLCGINVINTKVNPGVCLFIFRGETDNLDLLQSHEGELEWFEKVDLDNLPIVTDLHVLLPKILNMEHGESPFFAYSEYTSSDDLIITIK